MPKHFCIFFRSGNKNRKQSAHRLNLVNGKLGNETSSNWRIQAAAAKGVALLLRTHAADVVVKVTQKRRHLEINFCSCFGCPFFIVQHHVRHVSSKHRLGSVRRLLPCYRCLHDPNPQTIFLIKSMT